MKIAHLLLPGVVSCLLLSGAAHAVGAGTAAEADAMIGSVASATTSNRCASGHLLTGTP
jgi:hypothetical protein